MKKVVMSLWLGYVCLSFSSTINNDQQAYEYCKENKNTFIVIVWPIAQGKDAEIENILNSYGVIKYKKNRHINEIEAYYLLREAHKDFLKRRGIKMSDHVRWYFPEKRTYHQPARIYVWECRGGKSTAVTCKHVIRRMFDLQYRPIHINDVHDEALELAEFFFG